MALHNVATQEGSMRVVQATLLVAGTLFLLLIFWPLIPLGFALLIGSGWGWILIIIAPFALYAGYAEAAQKQRRENAYKYQQQVVRQGRAYLDSLREQQKGK